MVKPSRRREMAQQAVADQGLSIRLAFAISETCYRYQPILSDENAELDCAGIICVTSKDLLGTINASAGYTASWS